MRKVHITLGAAIAVFAMSSGFAADYKQVDLTHSDTDGFTTILQQNSDHWTLFVTNGSATLVFKRAFSFSSPNLTYSDDGTNTTLHFAFNVQREYVCTDYPNTRMGYPEEECNTSCSPCQCDVCEYWETADSSSLPALQYGP